ncbi:MAG TPA: LLM class flavin-dependent oxidoreductase [Acidimicrobiales bacterium]|nr:LLM class flavin-dependent oxidoreductase [Acidimicrobiales bacterium]
MSAPRVPLSMLDLAIVSAGRTSVDALAATTAVAKRADALGFKRFWVAEHHNMASVASTTPPVLMAHLAAVTEQIHVGSGGIMLPNHPPLVVAEHIAALEALYPGRVDLGLGRAPGTDQRTAAALRRQAGQLSAEEYPRDLLDLMSLLGDPRDERALGAHFRATPAAVTFPEIWLLGSSGFSAQLAGMLGLPYSFAHHFGMGGTEQAVELYRKSFEASPVLEQPYLLITANVLVAETEDEANRLAAPGRLMTRDIGRGRFEPLQSPDDAIAALETVEEPVNLLGFAPRRERTGRVAGTPEQTVAYLDDLVATTGADEVMVSTVAYDAETRVRSTELLHQAWLADT